MNQNRRTRLFGRLAGVGTALVLATSTPVAFGQAGGAARGGTQQSVTLAVQDTDLGQVLAMLAIQFEKNIITSRNVSATINANLFDVSLDEALHAILDVNGYGYRSEGNFIYIYTLTELEEMEARKRRRESRIYELDYLSAKDALEMIEPLLSDGGKAVARGDVAEGFAPSVSAGGTDSYAFTARVVVNDFPENLERIAGLIADIDTAPRQVLVEATILQSNLTEKNAFGVDFAALSSLNFTNLTNPLTAVNNLLLGNESGADTKATRSDGFVPGDNRALGLQSTVGNTAGAGGFKLGVVRGDVAGFLRLLDDVTDNTVLSRPKIMCLNRQRAEILVGAKIGYLSTSVTETAATQRVEFLDTGIQLTFRPFIAQNDMIRMELRPRVSEASLRRVTDQTGRETTIPDELTNELTTNVRIKDGQTLVLGGLYKERNNISRRQVPVLGDIPVLGAAFRGHDDDVARDEIIFMITPTIVKDDILWSIGSEAAYYTDKVMLGARQGLLPFSRERQTSNHNARALESFERGDVDQAVYHINNSLRLNSKQPEIARLRQRLLGDETSHFERSIIERAIRGRLGAATSGDIQSRLTPQPFMPQAIPGGTGMSGERMAGAVSSTGPVPATNPTTPADAAERERRAFMNRFIHEYFLAAGAGRWSPFAEDFADDAGEDRQPEMTTVEVPGAGFIDE
ncbi:MAG: hypothetical protein KF817_11215 [Phycisphaeraceae bacterium]|nr:hypothetical protein [Phycisphaeraceae bacterium]